MQRLYYIKIRKVSETLKPVLFPAVSNIVWEQEILGIGEKIGHILINNIGPPRGENNAQNPAYSCEMGFSTTGITAIPHASGNIRPL